MLPKHGIKNQPYSDKGCFNFKWQNQDTTHVDTYLRNIEGLFVLQPHLITRAPQAYSRSSSLFFSQSNSINEHMKRYHSLFITKSYNSLPKRVQWACLQWLLRQLNDFPRDNFMSFQPTDPKSIIHMRRIPLPISTSMIS